MVTAYLKWKNPQDGEHVYVLDAEEILLGRKSDADIILPNPYVSRHHAKLVKGKEGYSIIDLQNSHGTFVNGQRIKQQELHHGDRICLGRDRIELRYLTQLTDSASTVLNSEAGELEKTWVNLSSILPPEFPEHSDLEKISSILDFQYQWGKMFSADKTFEQILKSALKISGAERGYILLKQREEFDYVMGIDRHGQRLPQSDFRTSQSVARKVASSGEPIYMAEEIAGEFARQQSILNLHLRSLACMPLRWLSPEAERQEVQGVLYLDSTQMMHPLTGLDEKILRKLALEAGNVFEKLEMIKTFEQRKSLELELALVHNELRAADELRRAEAQILLSEYAASMGRFAAALSHDLNSPLGALKTALQTCNTLAEKKETLPYEKRREVEEIEEQLRRTAIESAERLHQIVLRMQRFTNLDRNELLPVDLNSLLQDVADMLKAGAKDKAVLELDFQPLPRLPVRPQQISAVFLNLLQNAIDGLNGSGHVSLVTRQTHLQVEVIVQDDGKGMSAEELATIFDPAFKVRAGRVSTGNWSLFSSRQIIREHGGEIEIQSSPGKGTRVCVTLPCLAK
jgi:signal transduction histidine kinase